MPFASFARRPSWGAGTAKKQESRRHPRRGTRKVTVAQMAADLGVSPNTVYWYVNEHMIPSGRKGCGLRFDPAAVRHALESRPPKRRGRPPIVPRKAGLPLAAAVPPNPPVVATDAMIDEPHPVRKPASEPPPAAPVAIEADVPGPDADSPPPAATDPPVLAEAGPEPEATTPVLTAAEIGNKLGMTGARVEKCAGRGDIPSHIRDGVRLFDLDEVRAHLAACPIPERRGRPVDLEARRFNEHLFRIMCEPLDVGGIVNELAALTGLATSEIRARVDSARWDEPDAPEPPRLDANDRKYVYSNYGKSKDPAVKAWLAAMRKPSPN